MRPVARQLGAEQRRRGHRRDELGQETPRLPPVVDLGGRPRGRHPVDDARADVLRIVVRPDAEPHAEHAPQDKQRDLDYLIVDMPPGTGDIQLTLAQQVPVTGAVIVTTPQDIALLDARKGLKMFEKVGIPILGIVENMSTHICSNCGHEEHIFGSGGASRMAQDSEVELLGALPLDIRIREQTDGGKPTVVADPQGRLPETYRMIARRVAIKIAERAKDMSSKFPNIVVQNT